LVDIDTIKEDWYENDYLVYLRDVENYYKGNVIKEFVKIQCRFFNREKLVIIYDFKTGEYELKIE
jgi:hypothetical protein